MTKDQPGVGPGFQLPGGEGKFGYDRCALPGCGKRFVKRQHNHRYCCPAHLQQAGKVSTDPRYAGRRERQRRLAEIARRDALAMHVRAHPDTEGGR